jgi:L-threonylcarbamoyladenylate synthase
VIIGADDPGLIPALSGVLKSEGVAIVPCDTLYGIVGVVPGSEPRIRSIKGREADKPFLQLIADASWIELLSDARIPPGLTKHWPGPLTIVIPRRGGGNLAVRLPDSSFLIELISSLGTAIYSTSVNRAGQQPIWRFHDIRAEFERDVDLIVDAGDMPGGSPSTIIDATRRPAVVLRQGGLIVPSADLE